MRDVSLRVGGSESPLLGVSLISRDSCWIPGASLANIGITACFSRVCSRVATEGYPSKNYLTIQCLISCRRSKTLEANKNRRLYMPDAIGSQQPQPRNAIRTGCVQLVVSFANRPN